LEGGLEMEFKEKLKKTAEDNHFEGNRIGFEAVHKEVNKEGNVVDHYEKRLKIGR
jgi:hypothetical protein